ncbi:MAG: glycosyltransferase [Pseudomonadota bacterium]
MKSAVLLPCYNEAATIGQLIEQLKSAIPEAEIYVFDNNSTDGSAELARKRGVFVYTVKKQGKGHVVKAMFRDIEADYYIIMDADGTYPGNLISEHLQYCIDNKCDMLVGNRIDDFSNSQSRKGHYWGNRLLTRTLNFLFASDYSDILSGYRIMSRRFVKSVPLFSEGFEIETVLSVHAIDVDAKIMEVNINYLARVEGSTSKLNTYKDGFKILLTIVQLFHDIKPRLVYGFMSLITLLSGMFLGIPVIFEFFDTGLVERFPTAILASALIIISFIVAVTGIILSSISHNRKIIKKLAFLSNK